MEGDRTAFAVLRSVLAPFRDFDYRLFAGDLSDHLPGILSLVPDSALFALLDPSTTALDHEQFTGRLLARGLAPTEVLVRLDVAGLARVGSALREAEAEHRIPGEAEVVLVERLDRFLGGPWWHRDAMTIEAVDDLGRTVDALGRPVDPRAERILDLGRAGRVALRIAGRFAQQVERQTGFRTAAMPVRLRAGHLPAAVFVSCARGLDGLWYAADTLGQAGLDWYERWQTLQGGNEARRAREQVGQLSLFSVEETRTGLSLEAYQRRHEPKWITSIERNIVRLLVDHGPFVLAERLVDVYGDTLGLAGSTHVRRAVRNLHDDGLLVDDGTDERFHMRRLRPVASVRQTQDSQRRLA